MGRRCPPGVLCIENATLLFIICICLIVALYYYYNKSLYLSVTKQQNMNSEYNIYPPQEQPKYNLEFVQSKDIFTNPYMPPLKHNFFVPPTTGDPRGIPINIPTRGFISEYKQLGLLERVNGKETVLPLMGRPLYSNRSKWKYYTMTDKNNSVKVPISKNGRSCTQEYGCDELMNGDILYVEGYEDTFKATIYDNEHFNYIPYL